MIREFEIFELSNGIRVIHQENKLSDVAHLGVIINVGTRDEEIGQHGIAHYIEHALFKGTKKRKPFHILNRIDSVGGEINAFTTKEDTCIYASFLKTYYDRTAELLADIIINSTFPEKEIEKEKQVIFDEIQSYLDTPSEIIFDDYEKMLFPNSSLGNDILGDIKQLKKVTQNQVKQFIQQHYVPENMVISSVGNISSKRLKNILEKRFEMDRGLSYKYKRTQANPENSFSNVIKKKTYQCHHIIGNSAYSIADEKKTGLILLNNLLGGPAMNSRLNMEVREKHGLTYNIESSYISYSDTGVFSIYLGTDKDSLEKASSLVGKELKKMRDNKLSPSQLKQAKTQLLGQISLSNESKVGIMLSIGKSLSAHGSVDTLEEVYQKIEALTANDLLEIANEVFDPNQLSTLTYLSK